MMEGSPDENLDYSWYLDSGCTEHMTSMDVYGALHHQEGKVTSIGGVTLNCHTPAGPRDIAFKEVLLVPSLRKKLLSVKRICEKGGKVTFMKDQVLIKVGGEIVMEGSLLVGNDLYRVNLNKPIFSYNASIGTWHQRLGHLSDEETRK